MFWIGNPEKFIFRIENRKIILGMKKKLSTIHNQSYLSNSIPYRDTHNVTRAKEKNLQEKIEHDRKQQECSLTQLSHVAHTRNVYASNVRLSNQF